MGPGDVQWMTAGSGVVHSEMPHPDFLRTGGVLNGFQLWVNLLARDKMIRPRYQEIPAAEIPVGRSPDGLAEVRVLAGEALGKKAVIETHTPIEFLHFTLRPGARVEQPVSSDRNAFLYVISGEGTVADRSLRDGQVAVFGPGEAVVMEVPAAAAGPWSFLLLSGRPLNEPVARYGPFVMNNFDEITRAFEDYHAGRLNPVAV